MFVTAHPPADKGQEDEDLLLSVMIARQSGTGLGFKLTPAYLLQMCIAYCSLHLGWCHLFSHALLSPSVITSQHDLSFPRPTDCQAKQRCADCWAKSRIKSTASLRQVHALNSPAPPPPPATAPATATAPAQSQSQFPPDPAVDTVMSPPLTWQSNPTNPDMLLFWLCNTLKLAASLARDSSTSGTTLLSNFL